MLDYSLTMVDYITFFLWLSTWNDLVCLFDCTMYFHSDSFKVVGWVGGGP